MAAATVLWAFFSGFEAWYSHYKNNFRYKMQWTSIDAAKTQQCGPKFAAPFDLGSGENATFQDTATGVKIEILSETSGSYKVRVTNGRH